MLTVDAIRILKRVRRKILAEPKRLMMRWWFIQRNVGGRGRADIRFPACGKVGCIGGWTEELYRRAHPGSSLSAADILQLHSGLSSELFYDERLVRARGQQTKRHAEDVAKHIDRFIEKYR